LHILGHILGPSILLCMHMVSFLHQQCLHSGVICHHQLHSESVHVLNKLFFFFESLYHSFNITA
uniref:Ovule protein n=1 Tax=Brugia timori TaxID=42155 RepID=A0A0R3QDI0_9BILA